MAKYPAAIGPYSAYRVVGDFVYCSGQLPVDPKTSEFPSDCIKEQTKQSLKNVGAILEEVGLGFNDIIKTTVLLSDIADFAAMNEVYAEFFQAPYPARSSFAAKDLPKGAKVEIEVIAYKK